MKKSTIKDVAREAGVSVATVSRVFNNSSLVIDDTRDKVLGIANQLHFIPNPIARSLSRNRTDAVGLLLPDLHGEFFSEVIRGVDQVVQANKKHLLVSSSHNERNEIEAALRMMRGRVDGIIIMSPGIDAETLLQNISKNLPVVLLNCFVQDTNFDSINIDNYGGAYQSVLHLISHNHRRIAIIKGTENNYDSSLRLKGYRQALVDAGVPTVPELEIDGDFTEAAGAAAAKAISRMQDRPTAVFAANDAMAIGAIAALRELGIRIPDDIAIAGFDDIPIARSIMPGLTSVHTSISELGMLAMNRLMTAIDAKEEHHRQQTIIRTTLVVRESCGSHVLSP
ncbi:MAG: LacI family DNA-binding transcriptional regulator [Ignavibacteriales bacterium]|nr:LacI family DNA-binding transcriptional regulator [Ignavibacteriales bacterium]